MADSLYHYDILGPIAAGMRMAAAPREMALQERSQDIQEMRLLEEFRQARELSRYREVEQNLRDRAEQRLREQFQLDRNLQERQAKVLQNIDAETAALRGQLPFGPQTLEVERNTEMMGMARGLAASGYPRDAVDVIERQSAERVAAGRLGNIRSALQPEVIDVGGGRQMIWNPATGKAEMDPVQVNAMKRQQAVVEQQIKNVEGRIKELNLRRDGAAKLLQAKPNDRDRQLVVEALDSMLTQHNQELNALTRKLTGSRMDDAFTPNPDASQQPEGPLGGLFERWEQFIGGQNP